MPLNGNTFGAQFWQVVYYFAVLCVYIKLCIRASVDALCRDGTSEISRDPRTKRLQTRRESLAMPSKHTNKGDVGMSVHEKERKQEDAYTKTQTPHPYISVLNFVCLL